jgi:hypothetical protein
MHQRKAKFEEKTGKYRKLTLKIKTTVSLKYWYPEDLNLK